MKPNVEIVLNTYLNLSGKRDYRDFSKLYDAASKAQKEVTGLEFLLLEYVKNKCKKGLTYCAQLEEGDHLIVVVDEEDIEDMKKNILGGDLGKIVDHGTTTPGNSDKYWRDKKIQLVFHPNDASVRKGEKIPNSYKSTDIRFLENFYGLKAFEFGNWLSQQDRFNYLAGLGVALYDLHKILGLDAKQIGINGKLGISFGARGRGSAVAHFEPADFIINLTRYSRPQKEKTRPKNFSRVKLILQDGGVGSFAHEFAHALDHFAGTYIIHAPKGQVSGGDNSDPAMRYPSAKKPKVQSLMDSVLNKIIWKNKNSKSAYYARLIKGKPTKYYIRRNEIWARAFEVYIQYKLDKKGYKNVFLNESKYEARYYLKLEEMKQLEKDFDALMAEIKKHL